MTSNIQRTCRRVNRTRLPEFVGQPVRFLGRVAANEEGLLVLEAPDGGQVRCKMSANSYNISTKFVEVLGTVTEEGEILVEEDSAVSNISDYLDMDSLNDTINVTFHPDFNALFTATASA
eukprot:GHVT01090508.1.p2 GENE.GHVT01090508.1~~GHVT01090508.1.p2  ORF type:complete len:120 (-),score=18.80 GHVT01090508.1:2597-2956(-)